MWFLSDGHLQPLQSLHEHRLPLWRYLTNFDLCDWDFSILSGLLLCFLLVFWNGTAKQDASQSESDAVPTPVVIIDQDSDPDATVVEITFGDRLGALLDTV